MKIYFTLMIQLYKSHGFVYLFLTYNSQGNVGLSGKPGPKVKTLKTIFVDACAASSPLLTQTCLFQGQDGSKGDKGSPGSPGNPGEPGLRGKDVSKSSADVTAMCYF